MSWRVGVAVPLLAATHLLLQLGFGVGPRAPDLMAVALLVGAREVRVGWAAGLGLLLGLLEDAFALLSFGANAVTFTLLGILGARTRDFFVGDSVLFIFSYLAGGVWLRTLLHWLWSGSEIRGGFVDVVLLRGVPGAVYAAAAGFVVLLVTGGWKGDALARP